MCVANEGDVEIFTGILYECVANEGDEKGCYDEEEQGDGHQQQSHRPLSSQAHTARLLVTWSSFIHLLVFYSPARL